MNFKRILVLVMALVMLVSACAPAIHATAGAIGYSESENGGEIDYVSLGDSMTNGLGLEGYDHLGNEGYLELAEGSYPDLFAGWLAGGDFTVRHNGGEPEYYYDGSRANVTLVQLATTGVRAEDLLYILNADSDVLKDLDDAEFNVSNLNVGVDAFAHADNWTLTQLLDNADRWGINVTNAKGPWAAQVANTYQKFVADADVISLAVGNTNFESYLIKFVSETMALADAESYLAEMLIDTLNLHEYLDEAEEYAKLTLAQALALCESSEVLSALVVDVYNGVQNKLSEMGLSAKDAAIMAGCIAVVTAKYAVSYENLVDTIVELNPDVELVIVPLVNHCYGVGLKGVDLGEILDWVYTPVNAYVAGMLTTKQLQGEYEGVEFYYADDVAELELADQVVGGITLPHPTANGHKVLADALIGAYGEKYTVQDETIENIKESVVELGKLVAEYYDEAYAFGYAYADEQGYIDMAVAAIDELIVNLETLDLSGVEMTDEFRAELEKEIAATIVTLKEIRDVLANDSAKDVPALLNTLNGLMDDLNTHLANVYALCAQAGIDVNQLIILPVLEELIEIIVEKATEYLIIVVDEALVQLEYVLGVSKELWVEIAPTVFEICARVEDALELANEIYNTVVNFLVENDEEIEYAVKVAKQVYLALVEFIIEHEEEIEIALDIAGKAALFLYENREDIFEAYQTLVEFLIENEEEIDVALHIAGIAFEYLLEVAKYVYENPEEVYAIATEVYANLVKAVIITRDVIDVTMNVIDVLIDLYGDVEKAVAVAIEIYNRAIEYNDALVEGAHALYNDIYDIIVAAYGETQDALYTAEQVYLYFVQMVVAFNAEVEKTIYNASNGSYELTDDSAYVALGNSAYGEELAALLNLGGKFTQYGVNENYLEAVAGADLVTLKMDNGEFYAFAYAQAMGLVAELVRSNEDIMGWCENPWVGEEIRARVESYGIDLDAEAVELDWSAYLDDDKKAVLDHLLAKLEVELVKAGVPETVEIDINPEIEKILAENNLVFEGVSFDLDPIVVPAAKLAVYTFENLLYRYVVFLTETAGIIEDIYAVSPNATVAITAITSPLDLFAEEISAIVPDYEQYSIAVDYVVDAVEANLYGFALANENVIFVDSEDANDIYEALHVYCDHVYDDCTDVDCNRCLQVRVAPGHSFTNYVYNNDTTCEKNGTETAKCDNCDATDTRTIKNSATGHVYDNDCDARCNVCDYVRTIKHKYDNACDTDCNVCGKERNITHAYGDWVILEKATSWKEGLRERVCSICGHVEQENYAKEKPEVNPLAIIGLAMGSIVVAFAASTAIIIIIQKKREN